MIHPAVCVERNTMNHQKMNGSSVPTVNCGSTTAAVLEKLNSIITVLASKLQLVFSERRRSVPLKEVCVSMLGVFMFWQSCEWWFHSLLH